MKVPFLDLSRQVGGIRAELDEAVRRVLDSGHFIFGSAVDEFESAFASFCGVRHAVGVASGTDAIAIALEAVGVAPGDEVLTAANTCIPTVAGIEACGAVPVLVDVDRKTLTLDPDLLAEACTPRTRAIVPVHLYGQCADMQPIIEFAHERDLRVVEDAAQAHGAGYGGRRAGALADAAAFSFYPTKNLGALGDAGAVVSDDDEVAEQVRLLRNYGEQNRYESVCRGRNSRLDTLQAAVLLVKLPFLNDWTARRRVLARRYLDGLGASGLDLPIEAVGREHVYHLFVIRTRERERLRTMLQRQDIGTLVHYPRPVHGHPAYESLGRDRGLAVSEAASREVLSLPLFPELTDAEADAVVAAVLDAASRIAR